MHPRQENSQTLSLSLSILIGLDWPSMRARVFIRKLKRVISAENEKLSSQVYKSFAGRDVDVSNLTIC